MKETFDGYAYDTKTSMALTTYSNGLGVGKGRIEETSYRTTGGEYFIVQKIDGKKPTLFPMSSEDMAEWSSPNQPFAVWKRKARRNVK